MTTHYNYVISITVVNKTVYEEAKRWITQQNVFQTTDAELPIFLKKKG